MKIFVTGGAGFIGSHLVDRFVARGDEVTVYDNLSSGKESFLEQHLKTNRITLIKDDLLNADSLNKAMRGKEAVFHLAANPDIRRSLDQTDLDLTQGTLATYNVLKSMQMNGVKMVVFTSSSVVYGETTVMPTPEDYGPLAPISLYGASKLACEGLISSFCHIFGMRGWIFRFANIVGTRATHGIIADFIVKLTKDREELEILGDGKQKKSFLLVDECIDAMLFAFTAAKEPLNIFNIGSRDSIGITRIADMLIRQMGLAGVSYRFTGGPRGWKGDVPQMLLSIKKLNSLGWRPRSNSEESVKRGITEILCKRSS